MKECQFLWSIDGPVVQSYLFGTIHSSDPRITQIDDIVESAFNKADVFVTEQARALSAESLYLPEGKTLADILSKDLYDKLKERTKELFPKFARMKIWAASMLLQYISTDDVEHCKPDDNILDFILFQKAVDRKKPIAGLESPNERVSMFESFSIEEQIDFLESILSNVWDEGVDRMVELYIAGDINALGEYIFCGSQKSEFTMRLNNELFAKRNKLMANRIVAQLNGDTAHSYFIAVGVGHFCGENNLLNLLNENGLSTKRLKRPLI